MSLRTSSREWTDSHSLGENAVMVHLSNKGLLFKRYNELHIYDRRQTTCRKMDKKTKIGLSQTKKSQMTANNHIKRNSIFTGDAQSVKH